MRVRTAQVADTIDLPTRRLALKAGLGLVAAVAMPVPAWARILIKKPSRELAFVNLHTGERLRAEYVHNGQVVPSAMHAISVVMRDHYNNKVHPIDQQLLDIAHVLQSHVGNRGPINLVCGYRSPETNAMMHEISAGVAAHSMHVEGKAMDIRMPGTRLASLRKAALALEMGGVGYYPHDDFVHIDSGAVRKWVG
jgi:uncharacterized protein YcbK (DUF882 family)